MILVKRKNNKYKISIKTNLVRGYFYGDHFKKQKKEDNYLWKVSAEEKLSSHYNACKFQLDGWSIILIASKQVTIGIRISQKSIHGI